MLGHVLINYTRDDEGRESGTSGRRLLDAWREDNESRAGEVRKIRKSIYVTYEHRYDASANVRVRSPCTYARVHSQIRKCRCSARRALLATHYEGRLYPRRGRERVDDRLRH